MKKGGSSYGSVFGALTRLRQFAVHPDLPGYRYRKTYEKAIKQKVSQKLVRTLLDQMKAVDRKTKCTACQVIIAFFTSTLYGSTCVLHHVKCVISNVACFFWVMIGITGSFGGGF